MCQSLFFRWMFKKSRDKGLAGLSKGARGPEQGARRWTKENFGEVQQLKMALHKRVRIGPYSTFRDNRKHGNRLQAYQAETEDRPK